MPDEITPQSNQQNIPENPSSEQEQKRTSLLHNIRTFKSDATEAMTKEKMSLSDIYMKGQKNKQEDFRQTEGGLAAAKNKKIILLASLAGVVVLIVVISSFFLFFKKKKQIAEEAPKVPAAILKNQKEISLQASTPDDFEKQWKGLTAAQYRLGDLIYFPINKDGEYLNSKDFLSFLKTKAPIFLTTYIKDDFFLGLLGLTENYPFLIFEIKENYYENTFSGLLKWEKDMFQTLAPILTTSDINMEDVEPIFKDKIISNQSARIVEKNGEAVFLYSVLNKKYIIITGSGSTLQKIVKEPALFK